MRIVKERNAPQKHVWRAQIVLLTVEGLGTSAIMPRDGQVQDLRTWRRRSASPRRFFEGLLRDKTRPSRIPKLDPSVAERVVGLTSPRRLARPRIGPAAAMARAAGVSISFQCSASGGRMGFSRIACANSSCRTTPNSSIASGAGRLTASTSRPTP